MNTRTTTRISTRRRTSVAAPTVSSRRRAGLQPATLTQSHRHTDMLRSTPPDSPPHIPAPSVPSHHSSPANGGGDRDPPPPSSSGLQRIPEEERSQHSPSGPGSLDEPGDGENGNDYNGGDANGGGGDGDDDSNPDDSGSDLSASEPDMEQNLAVALSQLARSIRKDRRKPDLTSRVKPREPDTFNGSDPTKLSGFILQCKLYFRANRRAFRSDSDKVNFALSYLRDTALQWFEPSILDDDEEESVELDWMFNWRAFVQELNTNFGTIDPVGDAEDDLENLKMKDTQRIIRYNVEFNKYAARAQWDQKALQHRYYKGLPDRIKDMMGNQGKPDTLKGMKIAAQQMDARHWERVREKSRAKRVPTKSDKPSADANKKFTSQSNNNSGNSGKKDNRNKSNSNQKSNATGSASDSAPPKKPSISDKLGKDGKLTSTERQRRFDQNLCMFCGGVGHMAKDCNKSGSSASKAKGRSAITDKSKDVSPVLTSEKSKK
jgi:hypothetical protein